MATRFGDANENGNENFPQDQYEQSKPRRATKLYVGPTAPTHGFVFRAFNKESLINTQKRKASKAKKHSTAYLDPAKPKPQPDPCLASGQQLPVAVVRQLPSELAGKPIEDIDPYYADQETFVIISRGKELTRFSATKALYLFGPFHPIRQVVLYILVNPIFNLLVILTILINCILMTIQGSETVENTEIIFTIVYTTEMGLKVLARGFIMDEFTYLRDPWNWLDFLVIVMAYLTIVVQDLGNLSVIRTFRVLRALKTVAIIPGMKTIVGAVIDSVKNLKDVVVLTLFSLSVFSLLGLQIYMGQLTQKCILNGPINLTDTEWFNWCSNSSHWVPEPDDEIFGAYRLCGNATGAQSCPADHTCLQGFGPNPDYGFTNFDTFGWSLICSFRLMTQDFWEGLYMQVLKTAGSWHIIFFLVSIFLGSIYLMNLILAIVAMSYNELQRRAEEEEEAAAEDEAAFLESCRLMEMQEQMSEFSYDTPGGGQTSYRPSVEIGLVGQSLLASLCQNGLLGQHVRDKLNEHMILPGVGGGNVRSHSLSVNFEHRGSGHTSDGRGLTKGCDMGANTGSGGKGGQRASMVPNYHDPPMMASSMTELRRKSSERTADSSSPVHSSVAAAAAEANQGTCSGRGGERLSPIHRHSSMSSHNNNNKQTTTKYGYQLNHHHRQQNKLSPHHVSSSVLMTPSARIDREGSLPSSQLGGGRRSTRSSTTSDRDFITLKQRAALIRIGDKFRRESQGVQSSDMSENTDQMLLEDEELDRLYVSGGGGGGNNRQPHHRHSTTTTTAINLKATHPSSRRRSEMERSSTSSESQHLSVSSAKPRTKSHDYSFEQCTMQGGDDYHHRRTTSVKNNNSSGDYFARVSRVRSEAAICKQPTSIHSFTTAPQRPSHKQHRRSVLSNGSDDQDQSVKSYLDPPTTSGAATAEAGGGASTSGAAGVIVSASASPASSLGAPAQTSTTRPHLRASTRTLHSTHSHATLSIEPSTKMHHLSVENFQQFGAIRPQLQQQQAGDCQNRQQVAASVAAQQECAIEYDHQQQQQHHQQQHAFVGGRLTTRGRLESQQYIHPTTMMRSSFARPRQSIVAGPTGATGARRMSKDFVRRASDWSRLSMSANVDLRRLLRLWSHTNPYQGRPSIGSFSNYSQACPSVYGDGASQEHSIRDAQGAYSGGYGGYASQQYSQSNSPRPSSAGSARQAYELISAFSRRQNRYAHPMYAMNDQTYALPLDDNMIDKMSVNMRDKCLAYCLSCLDILCIWECCGAWLKIQKIISIVVFDPFTELFIILCIIINTLFMALDSNDADAQMKNIFERGNYFFTATFAVEASMKIMALSPKFYFREGWNVFDSIIVGLSLLELCLEGVYGLSVLRSFRLLRVFKLAKSWPTLNLLISIMGKAVGDLGNLTFVLAIIVFIFAVMGMQLFGNKYVDHNFPSGELPRWNFTDFMHSFMIVFRILCAEWIEPMWDCLLVGGWPCIPFFLIAVTVGNLVVLNLFLALLLASFGASNLSSPQADSVDTKKLQEAIARFSRFGKWSRRRIGHFLCWITSCALGRKRGGQNGGLDSANHKDGFNGTGINQGKSVKSHIAAMSKLERLKNIELRTEELKSKIRRSPEHHFHLRQLAKSQLKESVRNPQPGSTGHGYNYNYKSKNYSPDHHRNHHHRGDGGDSSDGSGPIPLIPIIVNEAISDGCDDRDEDSDSDERSSIYRATISPSMCISPAISEELGEINENQASIADLYYSKLATAAANGDDNKSATAAYESSQASGSGVKQVTSRHPSYCVNMQPIKEDSRDSSISLSEMDNVVAKNDGGSLDKLAQDEISFSLSQWKFPHQLNHASSSINTTEYENNIRPSQSRSCGVDDMAALQERLIKPAAIEVKKTAAALGGGGHASSAGARHRDDTIVGERDSAHEEEHGEEERPKSSLYLKAPERADMEEDDERALQHIETYIEKCICIGILCLKWFLFRQYVRKIVEHRYFDQCILVLIVISSGTLALEDKHLNERPTLKRTLDVLDTIFTIIFSLEMIFKWLAFGMKRYFGNIWSWLDFVIVLVSFINLMASIFGSGKIQALKTMRTLRAMRGLRPLRALQRFQGMRVVVNALIQAIPSIFNVLLVCLIFWLIFSIMGVQMFGGKFWRCLDPVTHKIVSYEVAANRVECLERNLTWSNPQINFDNVLNAYLALFQVATFKGWIDIMNSATDSRMRDDQPIREANIYMYLYFVFFVIFGSFFTLNLFIGVIIDNFNEQKKKTGGSLEIFMTDDQKKYYHAMKKMRSKRPVKAMTRPKLKLQAYMFDITTSKKFDMAIMLIIGLNMFVMALEHYGQSQEFSLVLENLNLIFIAIFTLECLCKIFAMRHFYFREPWNIFDFIVVDLSILGVVMKEYVAKYFVSPTLLRVVRVVKVGRVLRLVKGAKGIRTLLFALAMSLPALFNICLLLFLVMFIYAIFGMSFFMNVRKRAGIDETFNFETFTSSIIVLFQMSTSAGWELVLDPLMDEENDCQKPDPAQGIEGTCGNKGIAIFYLISYVILTFLIIINMYIAVILENYSQATEDVQEGLTDDDYEMYYEIWQKFDPDGTQYLPYDKLSDFVDALEDPLRIPKPNDLALVIMDINIYEGLVIQVNEHLQKVQSTLHETPFERITTTYLLKRRHYCARLIQNCWRRWRQRSIQQKQIDFKKEADDTDSKSNIVS